MTDGPNGVEISGRRIFRGAKSDAQKTLDFDAVKAGERAAQAE